MKIDEMTKAEAIELLHPDTTRTALAKYEYYGGFNGHEAEIKAIEKACLIACEAIQESIERDKKK